MRSALALSLVAAGIVAASQLAGVAGRDGDTGPTPLVFDGVHETWLVQVSTPSRGAVTQAAARLGGGKAGRKLDGGWYEVQLGDAVAAADAEAAFVSAGAVMVEPVLPRMPYVDSGPDAIDDPAAPVERATSASTPTSSSEPEFHDDPPSAIAPGGGSSLRNGPVAAARIAEQWALSQPSDHDLDAPEAWRTTTGAGAVVAVIDTGVDATHPDLAGRVLAGRDFSGSSTGATVDRVGHGTHVASIIAGNGTSIAGIAPDARILPLKVFRDSEGGFTMSGYLEAIRYAADQGADVINISLGCGGSTSCFSQAELDALTYATERGVTVIAAAGNSSRDNDAPATPDFPSGYEIPGIVSVTSSTRFGEWSTWSSFGRRTVDLAAPGEAILVAAPLGSYRTVTGSSFSAPYTSGVAALIVAQTPTLSPTEVRERIVSSVVKDASLATRTSSGGVLNAERAVASPQAVDAGGGGAGGGAGTVDLRQATQLAPASGAVVGTPPVMTWSLPAGWSSQRVLVSLGRERFDQPVPGTRRALAHPAAAWRSGTYRWQVVARDASGVERQTAARTYRVLPRVGAWVSSGRLRSGRRDMRLRVGYAASEPSATVRVTVVAAGRTVHAGTAKRHATHARGTGSPRRGWITYDARLTRGLRSGERILVEVRVAAGGVSTTRSFRATVA